jgi:hypothetical protein
MASLQAVAEQPIPPDPQSEILGLTQNVIGLAVPVIAGGRVLDILIALLERPGEVVTHQELTSTAWPDVKVEDDIRIDAGLVGAHSAA